MDDALFGELRHLLHRPPSAEAWVDLSAHLELLRDEPGFDDEALPYARGLLASWPDALRRAPPSWLEPALTPLLTLARSITAPSPTFDDTALARLLSLPGLVDVRGLDLGDAQITSRGAGLIAASPWMGQLLRLDLQRNRIKQLAPLCAHAAPSLRELVVRGNIVGDEGAFALAEARARGWAPHLVRLDMARTTLGSRGLLALGSRGVLHELEAVALGYNRFQADELRPAHAPKVRDLSLQHAGLHDELLTAWLDACARRLRRLDVSRNAQLGAFDPMLFARHTFEALEALDVRHNASARGWLLHLLGHEGFVRLRHLSLSPQRLDATLGHALAEAPFASQLETLRLEGPRPDPGFWQALAQASMPALRQLDTSPHRPDEATLRLLCRAPGFSAGLRAGWLAQQRSS